MDPLIIEIKTRGLHRYQAFDKPELTLGRALDNDIILSDPTVEPYHVKILRHEDGNIELQNLAEVNPAQFNGRQDVEYSTTNLPIHIRPRSSRSAGHGSLPPGIGQPQVQSQSAPVSAADEKAAYEQAFQALKELRYADAAEDFQSFLDQYPNSDFADNAQYWLGESYYVTRNYDIALTAFQTLLDQYPESPKGPDALLKIGYTHYELEQWDSARAALTQVQEKYPDTTLSRLAENRLRSMRMEGHY